MTIVGSGFQTGAAVLFGRAAAEGVRVENDRELRCLAPGQGEGVVDVTVTNPDGQSDALERGFRYAQVQGRVWLPLSSAEGAAGGG